MYRPVCSTIDGCLQETQVPISTPQIKSPRGFLALPAALGKVREFLLMSLLDIAWYLSFTRVVRMSPSVDSILFITVVIYL